MTEIKRLAEIAAELDAEVAAEMAATREQRHARDMAPEEYKAKLAELRRGPKPDPMPLPEKHARDMSEKERAEWLADHKRRLQQ